MKLFVATLKQTSDIPSIQPDQGSIDICIEAAYRASGCRHIGFLSLFFFFLFITRREHLLYYPARWKKLTIPLYLSSRLFAKNGSKMRYRVIVKRHVARFAAAVLIKSLTRLPFSEYFSLFVVVGRRCRKASTKSSLLVVGRI